MGPRDEAGNPLGGQILATGSLEVEQMVLERWGAAAFADFGSAETDLPLRPEAGLGAGIRWRSPVGLVRLDGAFAVTLDGTPFRVHLRIGPDL